MSKIGCSSDDSLVPKHTVDELKGGRRMMIEKEQQMAWNNLDLQLYIFAHDVIT